jgi:protein associated with RNAse G/E
MPATMTATGITWVDLDIDYRVHHDGRIERLDEDEYHAHRERMGYPTHVQDQVQAACVAIEALAAQQLYPFNHATHVALYQQIKARE